ncbi:MAG: flagellar biosynthetic protein FliR [bacterium]
MTGLSTLFDLPRVLLFALLMARAGGLVLAAPFLSGRLVPRMVKVLFVGALALVMLPASPAPAVPERMSSLVWMVGGEILLGLALGLVSQLFVVGFQAAGEIIGVQMGFGMARILDPMSSQESTVMGRWLWLTAMTLFFTLGGVAVVIRALALSVQTLPPGLAAPGADVTAALVAFTGDAFAVTLRVAAPAIGILLLTSVGLGLLARTVPQMNVFIVGFPLKIAAGIVATAFTLPFLVDVARRELGVLVERLALLAAGS